MASGNPIDATVDNINAQIATAQAQLASHQQQLAAAQTRLSDWQHAGNSDMANKNAMIADAINQVNAATSLIATDKDNIAALNKQLQTKLKEQSDFNANLAIAAAKGLTGDAAIEHAKALTEEAKGHKALMIGAAIALVVVIIAAFLWMKHRKKK